LGFAAMTKQSAQILQILNTNKTFFCNNIPYTNLLVFNIKVSYYKILDKYMLRTAFFLLFLPLSSLAQTLLEPNEFEKSLRENPDAVLLDLRNVDAFMKGHIKKSTVIDFLRDDFKEYFTAKYKQTDNLYIYAQSAENSSHAAQYIAELGYAKVTGLKGGFENWIRKSKPYKSNSADFKPLSYVTKQNYFQIVKEKKWVLMVFHEDYCKECETMQLTFETLKKEIPDLQIANINFQTNVELAEWLNVTKNPTLILYKDGIQYWKTTGVTSKEKIKEHIY
jgi:thioredoxin 1